MEKEVHSVHFQHFNPFLIHSIKGHFRMVTIVDIYWIYLALCLKIQIIYKNYDRTYHLWGELFWSAAVGFLVGDCSSFRLYGGRLFFFWTFW